MVTVLIYLKVKLEMKMSNSETGIDKELFLKKFEKLSMHLEKLTDEVSKLKNKLDKDNKINRSFGLKVLRNSQPLEFAKDVLGIGSPTKRYLLSRSMSKHLKMHRKAVNTALSPYKWLKFYLCYPTFRNRACLPLNMAF